MIVREHRHVASGYAVELALRAVYVDLFRRGILPDEVANYRLSSDWFPWLKERQEIAGLARYVVRAIPGLAEREQLPPQIVFQPPDELDGPLVPHVDEDVGGGRFHRIVGLALTEQRPSNGGLLVWDGDEERPVVLDPGDAVELSGDVPHASGPNGRAAPRVAVYLRYR